MDIEKVSKGYRIVTNKNKFSCKFVINTLPETDSEKVKSESKGNYNIKCFVIDKSYKFDRDNIIDLWEKD